jgi:hypothetical protein
MLFVIPAIIAAAASTFAEFVEAVGTGIQEAGSILSAFTGRSATSDEPPDRTSCLEQAGVTSLQSTIGNA